MPTACTSSIPKRVRPLSEAVPAQVAGEVLCVGLTIQDIILRVPEIPTRPVKIYASERMAVGGGPAATASVAIARLGGKVSFAGRLGEDATGRALRDELRGAGVETQHLRLIPGHHSPSSVILVDQHGERLIVAYADPDLPRDASWFDPAGSHGAVLCDLSWPDGALKAYAEAAQRGIPRVLDADISRHPREDVEAIVSAADHVVFSRPGLATFSGTEEIAEGLKRAERPGHKLIGVTDGEAGIFWLADGEIRNMVPPAIRAVDTVGAGDAFHGALALALARSWPIERALAFSNAVAALKCSKPGGRAGLPTAEALKEFDPSFTLV